MGLSLLVIKRCAGADISDSVHWQVLKVALRWQRAVLKLQVR